MKTAQLTVKRRAGDNFVQKSWCESGQLEEEEREKKDFLNSLEGSWKQIEQLMDINGLS
jgi:hypothetical protein